MTTYLFPEPGVVPTIPGQTFAGVRVDVDEVSGTYTVSPLSRAAAFEQAPAAQEEPQEDSTAIEEEEQAPPPPAPPAPSLGG